MAERRAVRSGNGQTYAGRPYIQQSRRGGAKKRAAAASARSRKTSGADPMDYKGMTLQADGFTKFLSEKLVAPMNTLRAGFQSAQVLFDLEGEETGRIVVMYDFSNNTRRVCYVPTDTALAAAYAYENPETADEYEQECLGKVAESLAATAR
jgi:hypothetical protein